MVKAFDTGPTYTGSDFTTSAWTNYIAPVEKAANTATDDTLTADMLNYHTDLLMNGSNAYDGQPLSDLINYARAVYHIDVFPGS